MEPWLLFVILGGSALLAIVFWFFLRKRTKDLTDKFGERLKDKLGNPLGRVTKNYTYEILIALITLALIGYVAVLVFAIPQDYFVTGEQIFLKNFLRAGLYAIPFVCLFGIILGWKLTHNLFKKKVGEHYKEENSTKYYRIVETYLDDDKREKIRAKDVREGLNEQNPFIKIGKNPERNLWGGDLDGEEVEPINLQDITLVHENEKGERVVEMTPYLKGGTEINRELLQAKDEKDKAKVTTTADIIQEQEQQILDLTKQFRRASIELNKKAVNIGYALAVLLFDGAMQLIKLDKDLKPVDEEDYSELTPEERKKLAEQLQQGSKAKQGAET